MLPSIYEFRDYKTYVRQALDSRSDQRRGERSRLAEFLKCHSGYISQVLNGDANFSLEQGDGINQFLGHNRSQARFLLLLIQWARAGTLSLRKSFEEEIEFEIERQLNLKNRLEFKKSLSPVDQATFYSSWVYGAAHVLVSVPGCQTDRGISEYLGISIDRVSEIMAFLVLTGLVNSKAGKYEIGTTHIHLENDSPMISKHHSNWRVQALNDFEKRHSGSLHYSSVITCSIEDSSKIRLILLKAIDEIRSIVRDSKDEEAFCYNLDFFNLKK